MMLLTADQMAFRARALAQSEPFTQLAREVVQADMAAERDAQPGNFAIWANAAYTKGYCARRVEEDDVELLLVASPPGDMPPLDTVVAQTDTIAVALRSDDAELHRHLISDEDRVLDVLDQIIGSEVRNRVDNASEKLSARARQELEDYITFWVVKGYALRAAEQATGAIRADAPDDQR
ncbi:MAG: hypothetical protein ACRD12_14175 [Acidimicrobiales bacterium]